MIERLAGGLRAILCVAVTAQSLAGCGTIMHPERKGQRDGRIDAGIAVLDGIGLLFFIIPGVIAFAVDFSNGTIYLPNTHRRSANDPRGPRIARFDPRSEAKPQIERIVREETGRVVRLDGPDVAVERLGSREELLARLAKK